MYKRLLSAAALAASGWLLSTSGAVADQDAVCIGYDCSSVNITKLQIMDDGRAWIFTDGDEEALTCGNGTKNSVYLDTLPDGSAAYATLLTAYVTDKPIALKFHNAAGTYCSVKLVNM